MPVAELDGQTVVNRLKSYRQRIGELIDSLSEKRWLSREERENVQHLFRGIKQDLKKDYDAGSTVRGHAALTDLEKSSFHPVVHEAYCELRAAWNSDPIASRWLDQLYAAQIDFDFALQQFDCP